MYNKDKEEKKNFEYMRGQKSLCHAVAGRSEFNFHVILQVKNEAKGLLCACMRAVDGHGWREVLFFLRSKAIVLWNRAARIYI